MKFGFNQKFTTDTPTTLGAAYNRDRLSAPLVKTSDGGTGGGNQSGGGGGGGGTPLGCPKCVGWYWIPLGAVGVMTTLAWMLARK
jgi:hypothetical protein